MSAHSSLYSRPIPIPGNLAEKFFALTRQLLQKLLSVLDVWCLKANGRLRLTRVLANLNIDRVARAAPVDAFDSLYDEALKLKHTGFSRETH